MKKFVIAISLILFASVCFAQTNATVVWNQANALTDAQSFTYTLKIDTAAPINLTTTCTLVNTLVQCQAPLTSFNNTVTHTLVLTASNGSSSASGTFNTTPGPAIPTGAKIIVIIVGDDNE